MALRRLTVTAAVFVAASTLCSAATTTISISESSGSGYEPCSDADFAPVNVKILTEATDCTTKATYNWDGKFMPTTIERKELCACTSLMKKLETVDVPHCGFYRVTPDTGSGGFYSYKDLVEFAFGLCSASSSSTATPTTATKTPTPTYTSPYTYTPTYTYAPSYNYDLDASNSSSSKKSKSNTGVIVGVIVGVVVVAAIVGFVIRKRKQTKRNGGSGPSHDRNSNRNSDRAVEKHAHVAIPVTEELSPLGAGSYAAMPSSPAYR